MIVDCHVHVLETGFWPDEWFDYVAIKWAASKPGRHPGDVRGRIEEGLCDPGGVRLVRAMDEVGIAASVVLPLDWGPDFRERIPIEQVNQHALDLAQIYPGRIIPFVGIDPRRKDAPETVERFLDRGAKGLKLYPPTGWDPIDPRACQLYEVCEARGVPVLFHTGETLPRMGVRFGNPLLLQDVHANFPTLVSWVGHAGASLWWDEAVSVVAHAAYAYLELSAWIWSDTSEDKMDAFTLQLAAAVNRVGVDRIVFGSDYLSGHRVRGPGFLSKVTRFYTTLPSRASRLGVSLNEADLDAILGGTAAGVLGLSGPTADH